MMRNDIKYQFLSILLILPLVSPLSSGSGILPFLAKLVPQSQNGRNLPIPDERDPFVLSQIERLAFCESSGREDIKIVDTNGWYSHSCLQFQFPTFKQYVRRYNLLPDATDEELLNMIGDCEFQKDLAYRMIAEDAGNWTHWARCSEILGF